MRAVIISHPGLEHQGRLAAALQSGFIRHGINAEVTGQRIARADITVCLGPWYALPLHLDHTILYLDRAFWGDPDSVSLQWMVTGYKQFDWSPKPQRPHPELEPMKTGDATVILCDYQMDPSQLVKKYPNATVRRHPAEQKGGGSLAECLKAHQNAAGRHTTALVEAAIHGLRVDCEAPYAPCSGLGHGREHWINCLAWHNWHIDEIASGVAWDHLEGARRDYLSPA